MASFVRAKTDNFLAILFFSNGFFGFFSSNFFFKKNFFQ